MKLEGPLTIYNNPGQNYSSLGYTNWGVKWRFQEETKTKPAVSTYPQILFVGNEELARIGVLDPGIDVFLPLEAMKTFGNFQIDAEFGPLFRQFTGTELSMGVCSEYDLTKTLALLSEVHYISVNGLVEDQLVWNLGFKYDFTERQSLLFSAGRGFGPARDDNPGLLMYVGVQIQDLIMFRKGPPGVTIQLACGPIVKELLTL